jgi:DNA-binding FadR family transcriptional regulator
MTSSRAGASPPRRRRVDSRPSLKASDRVTRVLAARIINGDIGVEDLAPTEQEICAEFEVSKTTAREVIGTLAARGLVTVRHGRRMKICPAAEWDHFDPLLLELTDDPESVRRTLGDLHDLRMLLEPEIAARAALMATEEQLASIGQAVERMAELEEDPEAYLEIDVDFHNEVAAAAESFVLAFVLDSVGELLRVSHRIIITNVINAVPEATLAHRRIYQALLHRKPETARQAMRAHLLTVSEVWAPDSFEVTDAEIHT